jgi:hypothetical protein
MRSSESFESGDMPGVNQVFLTFPLTIPLRPRICPGYLFFGQDHRLAHPGRASGNKNARHSAAIRAG